MRLFRELLTGFGGACIGLALGGYVTAVLPQLYQVDNLVTLARCNLVLSTGIGSLVIAYGLRWPELVRWWLGCFAYLMLLGYLFWRTLARLELVSFFVLIALIAEMPFAAMWWQYRKLFSNRD